MNRRTPQKSSIKDFASVVVLRPWLHQVSVDLSKLMLEMAHINVYLYNSHQDSASYPFSSIDGRANAEADADAQCDQGLTQL